MNPRRSAATFHAHRLLYGRWDGQAQVGVAIAGDVHGNIYIAGQRGKTAAELLHAYLRRVSQRCGTLPLQGVREQKAIDDVLQIRLDQVYTQLATLMQAQREVFTEAITSRLRLVLLGEPGSGKSTALRYLAFTLAAAGIDPNIQLGERLAGWEQLGDQGRHKVSA